MCCEKFYAVDLQLHGLTAVQSHTSANMQQQLVEAIHTLYHHADPQVKKQTSAQLEKWQQSESAWSLSDSILHDTSSSMEAQYFCAQTLRTKVVLKVAECQAEAILACIPLARQSDCCDTGTKGF